jgi:uncharacterized protein DUF1570
MLSLLVSQRHFWIAGLLAGVALVTAGVILADQSSATEELATRKKKLDDAYVKEMMDLAGQARKARLDADAARLAKKVLTFQKDCAEAEALLNMIKDQPSQRLAAAQAAKARRPIWTKQQQLVQKTADGWLALATWCEKNELKEEKPKCLAAGLAIDPNHKNLHLAAGHKLHPEFGWIDKETDAKLRAAQRLVKGEWKPWLDIQKERYENFSKQMSAKLGAGFRYLITPSVNIASNLQNRVFEKQIADDLEALIRDEYRAFYGPRPLDLEPYNLLIFDQQSQFREFSRTESPNYAGSLGYYDGNKRFLYAWHLSESGVVNGIGTSFHEMTHGLFDDFMGTRNQPTWLNEGFASFFEMARTQNGVFSFGPLNVKRMSKLRTALEQRRPFDLEGLMELNNSQRFHDKDDILNYNRAAMLMHYLFERGKLKEFLQEFKTNPNGAEVLCEVLGEDLKPIEQQITLFAAQKLR